MPLYHLTDTAFIHDRLYHPMVDGVRTVVNTDLEPGPHMIPAIDADGNEDADARAAKDKASQRQAAAPNDPAYIMQLIQHMLGNVGTNAPISGVVGPLAPPVAVQGAGPAAGFAQVMPGTRMVPQEAHDQQLAEVDRLRQQLAEAEAREAAAHDRASTAEAERDELLAPADTAAAEGQESGTGKGKTKG